MIFRYGSRCITKAYVLLLRIYVLISLQRNEGVHSSHRPQLHFHCFTEHKNLEDSSSLGPRRSVILPVMLTFSGPLKSSSSRATSYPACLWHPCSTRSSYAKYHAILPSASSACLPSDLRVPSREPGIEGHMMFDLSMYVSWYLSK